MSCPVVRTIAELYGGYEYGGTGAQSTGAQSTGAQSTSIVTPSGVIGGGSTTTDISMETAKFYITMRKLQFARAELTIQQNSQQNSQHSIISLSLENGAQMPHDVTQPSIYFERMFKDYYGKTSNQILSRIIGQSKIYTTLTRAVDLIDIMEDICVSALARDFPSGMSIPTIYFDPAAIENINIPDNIYREINKIIEYANNLCIGGLRAKIELMPKFIPVLREFTFPTSAQNNDWKNLLELDMEVATYAHALEQYQCTAIKKLNEVMNLCQSIIDLGATA